ncbi:CPBP family intramembrane glutamic endopeptidase [Pseudactinotalea sp.]|uniref:CPBP family intramembrane glutamic endopeptidase n=1 Tax=Pseudactinotalea sp. TaxID=1926260 RepID=UPI003B3BAFCA
MPPYSTPTTTARWVVPVLVPLLAAMVLSRALAELPVGLTFGAVLGSTALWAAILVVTVLVTGGLAIACSRRRSGAPGREPALGTASGRWRALLVVCAFVVLTSVAARLPRIPLAESFDHNWQGKVIDLLWVGVLAAVLWRWARSEMGLTWRLRPGSRRPTLIVIGGVFTVMVGLTLITVWLDPGARQLVGIEQLLYNATIANLTEELIWRGAMLAVLDRAFGTPWRLAGAPVGWGLIISTVAFGAGHTVLLSPHGEFSLTIAGGVFAAVMGVLLAWVWAYTRSIWPAFVLHCAPEVAVDVGMLASG